MTKKIHVSKRYWVGDKFQWENLDFPLEKENKVLSTTYTSVNLDEYKFDGYSIKGLELKSGVRPLLVLIEPNGNKRKRDVLETILYYHRKKLIKGNIKIIPWKGEYPLVRHNEEGTHLLTIKPDREEIKRMQIALGDFYSFLNNFAEMKYKKMMKEIWKEHNK